MSEAPNTNAADTGSDEARDPAWYRNTIAEKDKENAALKTELGNRDSLVKGLLIEKAGFEEGSKEYSTLSKYYKGDLDADAIRSFADEEFGYKPGSQKAADPVAGGDSRLAAARAAASPQESLSRMEKIKQQMDDPNTPLKDRIRLKNAYMLEYRRSQGML